MMYGLYVFQQGNEYIVKTPQGLTVAWFGMPHDGQFMKDATAIKPMCKIIGKRWGINPNQDSQF